MKKPKIRPHSLEAERAVLGSILIDPDCLKVVAGCMTPTDMYLERHRKILLAINSIDGMGDPVDLLTVCERLEVQSELESCGGYAYLASLSDAVPVTTNVATHARTVADKARLRAAMDQAEMLIAIARDTEDPEKVAASAQHLAKLIQPAIGPSVPITATAAVEHASALWDHVDASPVDYPISWPWPQLEAIIGPLRRGKRPIIIGARSKVGKTMASLGVALCAAEQGRRVLLWQLELSRVGTVSRLLSLMAGVNADAIEQWQGLTHEQNHRVLMAAQRLYQMPLLFDASQGKHATTERYDHARTVEQITERIEQIQQRDGQELDLVICDYGQLVRANKGQGGSTQRERLIYVADNLQEMGALLGCPVIVTAQLNGKGEMARTEPSSADIQETDRFRQMCSASVILDRPWLRLSPDQQRMSMETQHHGRLIVDVNQASGLGTVSMTIDPSTGGWSERGW